MLNMLFARTFIIVGGMLVISSITAKINRLFETSLEMWMTIISSFILLFALMIFNDYFPLNLILVACFSAVIGWQIGPTINHFGTRFKTRKYFKSKGIKIKKRQQLTAAQRIEFQKSIDLKKYQSEWQNIIFKALFTTALAVFCSAGLVFFTSVDYGFLGWVLFIVLSLLVVMGFLNMFFFKSKLFSLLRPYIGAVIFTLYLLYDFNRLEKMKADESWGSAIEIAVSIYLDIINLFLDLLAILVETE